LFKDFGTDCASVVRGSSTNLNGQKSCEGKFDLIVLPETNVATNKIDNGRSSL